MSLSQMALIHELLPKSMPKRIKVEGWHRSDGDREQSPSGRRNQAGSQRTSQQQDINCDCVRHNTMFAILFEKENINGY